MTHDDVHAWLDRYVAAWRANEREPIEALFTEGAIYHDEPYGDDRAVGREQIATSWLADQDDPDSWEAEYRVYAIDGDRAVAVGTSRYLATGDHPERTFHNCFLLRFAADGRCAEFTDFYLEQPRG